MAEVLRGDLRRIRLSSLLQLFESEGLDGVLHLSDAELRLHRGQVVAARHRKTEGALAVLELFWVQEPFWVDDGAQTGEAIAPAVAFVMEGCRLLDEWARVSDLYLQPLNAADPGLETMPALAAALDGKRPFHRAVLEAGLSRAAATNQVVMWMESRLLRELPPPKEQPPSTVQAPAAGEPPKTTPPKVEPPKTEPPKVEPPKQAVRPRAASYADAMEQGRRKIREGQMEEAEELFQQALVFQPQDPIARQNLRWLTQQKTQGSTRWPYTQTGQTNGAR